MVMFPEEEEVEEITGQEVGRKLFHIIFPSAQYADEKADAMDRREGLKFDDLTVQQLQDVCIKIILLDRMLDLTLDLIRIDITKRLEGMK